MKKFHIFLAALLLLSVMTVLFPARANAAVNWTLENGVLTLSGDGPMADYPSAADAPWYPSRDTITQIVVENGITAIGSNSFTWCQNVIAVSLPEGLITIGKNAFWGCTALQQISLPKSLEYIGTCAFFKSGLTAVTVPAGVTVLEQGVFGQCQQLQTVSLPDTLEAIHKDAFSRCYALSRLQLPPALQTIGEHAFFACVLLQELSFPEELAQIGPAAFYGCDRLTALRFTGSAPILADNAFLGITATVYYPSHKDGWQAVAGSSYGGSITWDGSCDHQYTSTFTEPTCLEQGYCTFLCSRCGHSYQDLFVDALGHSFTNYISDGNASIDTDGTKTALCDRGCGATHTVTDEGSRLTGLSSDLYSIEEETIHAVGVDTTAAEFRSHISPESIRILKDGKPVEDSAIIGTGMVVQLLNGQQVVGAWVIIVTGDINGDGAASVTDLLMVKAHILQKALLEGLSAQAADTNNDHSISITDFIQIKAHILKKGILQPH